MSMKESNHAIQVKTVRSDFLKWDQNKMIERFALEHDEQFLYMTFFGKRYSIDRETAEVLRTEDGSEAGFSEVLTIYDMLCHSKEGARISGEWKTLATLSPHSNFGASGRDLFGRTLVKISGKSEELHAACQKLGGRPVTTADVGYEFDAFDSMPIIFQFWDADDEFPANIVFLFDANTLDFIHFETAWYIAGHVLGEIVNIVES